MSKQLLTESSTKRQIKPPHDIQDWSGRDWKNWADKNWSGKDWKSWADKHWSGRDWKNWADKNWSGKDWSGKDWSGKDWAGKNWSGRDWKNWADKNWSGRDWKSWADKHWSGKDWVDWADKTWKGWASKDWADWSDTNWSDKDWTLSAPQTVFKSQVKRVQNAEDLSPSGIIVNFSNSITLNVNAGISPNNQPDFTTQLTGTTQIFVGKPGNSDVSQTELVSTNSVGSTPFSPQVTVRLGDGVADLAATPSSKDVLLHSGGAVSKKSEHPIAGDTFFNVFLEIEDAPNGLLRNKTPITIKGDISAANFSHGQLKLNYGSSAVTPLYNAGADGIFWTGDEVEVARLVPGTNGNALTVKLTSSSLASSL